jgi:hypothetical protein
MTSPDDNVDRLLSAFFKAELPHAWPGAPDVAVSEPSALVADRAGAAETPRNQPAHRDNGNKARYTLAASVALLLGTCWALSDGFQSNGRPANGTAPGTGVNLGSASADGKTGLPGVIHGETDKPIKPKVNNPFGK